MEDIAKTTKVSHYLCITEVQAYIVTYVHVILLSMHILKYMISKIPFETGKIIQDLLY